MPCDQVEDTLIELADGDGRYLINLMESVFDLCKPDEIKSSSSWISPVCIFPQAVGCLFSKWLQNVGLN